MASRIGYLVALVVWMAALWAFLEFAGKARQPTAAVPTNTVDWVQFFAANILPNLPEAQEFDTPLRPPDGQGAFVTLPFGVEGHLGEDWTVAKGDAGLGEPVYSVADGWVSVAQDFENAWGKVAFVCYRLPSGRWPPFVEVMYAQLQDLKVKPGQLVKRGEEIGTVGNANGTYKAHLHWEVRQTVGKGIGAGFDTRNDGWLEPSAFIVAHRGDRAKVPLAVQVIPPAQRNDWPSDY